ncbi:MAG: hypothetical protein GC154_12485 [bacterium]|nr:hypothetical protein [bacterium]
MSADLLAKAEAGVSRYLDDYEKKLREECPGELPPSARGNLEKARNNVMPNLKAWLEDEHCARFSPQIPGGIRDAIEQERWDEIIDAFLQEISFGTAGIRGRMAFDKASILKMKDEGPGARILKGPATLNDKVLLLKSVGVAKFMIDRGMNKIVIGYDSRVNGPGFSQLITQLFLAYGLTVYLFDEACPYPEVTFSVPNLRADVGILISASHNDYRYNGYKLSCGNGSQFSLEDRKTIVNDYINKVTSADIQLQPIEEAAPDRFWWLGGSAPVEGVDYHGREDKLIDMHSRHINHMKQFLVDEAFVKNQKHAGAPLHMVYCAFHGAGRKAVPRVLGEVGFPEIRKVMKLDALDGMFPCFNSEPGQEQQPDPGDLRAAEIAMNAYLAENADGFEWMDVLIGTDPDADRVAPVVKIPAAQREVFDGRDWTLMPADDAWAILIWHRLQKQIEEHGSVKNADELFITLSHTTSDVLTKLALKHGVGVMKSWVGFAMLAMCVNEVWQGNPIPNLTDGRPDPNDPHCHPFMLETRDMKTGQRKFNLANMEQSCGFSILGGTPKDAVSMGEGGHVRDKDGVFAAMLLAEAAAYAKSKGTDLFRLLDEEIFLDPDIGYFLNYYEPDPLDGEYDGIKGYIKKREVIEAMLALHKECEKGGVTLAGLPVKSTAIYWTGKYDAANFPGFPDEGVRFFFDDDRWSYFTFRPSGTSNALRFHLQLHEPNVTRDNLASVKLALKKKAYDVVSEIRERVGALRER